MSKFQIGDRVVVTKSPAEYNTPVGERGVVVRLDRYTPFVIVKLDNPEFVNHIYFFPEELQLIQEEEFIHSYNRHSDLICWVMENEEVRGWYGKLEKYTNEAIPFPNPYKVFLNTNEKEIFFSLMWVVDDETLDALIEEMKRD